MPAPDTVVHDDTDTESDRLPIDELLASLQDEDKLTGVSSTFVRIDGYNPHCWLCDSFHTSWEPTHAQLGFDETVTEVESSSPGHAIVTSGGPLVHDETDALLSTLGDDYRLVVETNGTPETDASVDLTSISPKPASSTSTPNNASDDVDPGVWTERHENARVDLGAFTSLAEDAAEF